MRNNEFKKYYITVVDGILNEKNGTIDAPIGRKENSIIERCIKDDGDSAITHYNVQKEFSNMSLVNIELQTGRTHQIRVHMAYIGYPIIGDSLYGTTSNLITRQALHAYEVSCVHPITKKVMNITANIPEDIEAIMA